MTLRQTCCQHCQHCTVQAIKDDEVRKITKLVSTTITTFSSDVESAFEKAPQKTKMTRNQDICGDLLGMDMLFHKELQNMSEQTPEDGQQLPPEMVLMDRDDMGDELLGNQFHL